MKKVRTRKGAEHDANDMRPEYDFTKARRNPYAERFAPDSVAVVLDPDVAARYPTSKQVNEALRSLEPGRKSAKRTRRRSA